MAEASLLDLYMTDTGDFVIGHNGDLRIERNVEVVEKEILFRLKTYPGDWALQPRCGAGLEDFIGEPNTPGTAAAIELRIRDALTHDGFLAGELTEVKVVPISRSELIAMITVEYGEDSFTTTVTLDLKEGVLGLLAD